MKPNRYPYSGKLKLIKKELPRFVKLGNIAIKREMLNYIESVRYAGNGMTKIYLRIPRLLLNYDEKVITVNVKFDEVIKIINKY